MKVIGIGLNKTGTTTLGLSLSLLGYRRISYDLQSFEWWRRGDFKSILDKAASYEAFTDWPWPLLYREFDREFPGSKFILTLRKTPDIWYDSLCDHMRRQRIKSFDRVIYGTDTPDRERVRLLDYYSTHVELVREYFQHRPQDLLEVCWENGDGWCQIADFLSLAPPKYPFPHENKRRPWTLFELVRFSKAGNSAVNFMRLIGKM